MINTITIVALGVLFLARGPVALRRPQARPAWLASGVGIVALLSIGVIIPIPVADSWLGGSNLLFLLRTSLPVVAFWLLREAVTVHGGRRVRQRDRAIIAVLLIAQVSLFFLIPNRGTTNVYFVDQHMIYPAGVMWALAYVAAIVWTSWEMITQVRSRGRYFIPFLVGGAMTMIGGIALFVHCSLIYFRVVDPVSGDVPWQIFSSVFYPGILVIVGGFVAITARDAVVLAPWRLRALRLRSAVNSYGDGATHPVLRALRIGSLADPLHETYEAAIALRNLEYLDKVELRAEHRRQLAEVEGRLARVSSLPRSVVAR